MEAGEQVDAGNNERTGPTTSQFDPVPFPVAVFGRKGIVETNLAFGLIFGPEEKSLSAFLGRRNASAARRIAALFESDLQDDAPSTVILHDKTGSPRHFELHPRPASTDPPRRIVLTMIDVSQRVVGEEARAAAEQQRDALVHAASLAFALFSTGSCSFANKRFAEMFGFDRASTVAGKTLVSLVHGKDRKQAGEWLEGVEAGESRGGFEFQTTTRGGGLVQLELEGSPVTWGNEHGVFVALRDVTHRLVSDQERARQTRNLGVLTRAAGAVGAAGSVEEGVAAVAEIVRQVLSFDAAGVWLPGPEHSFVLAQPGTIHPAILEKLNRMHGEDQLGAYLFKTQGAVALSVAAYPAFLPHRAVFEAAGVAQAVFLPLVSSDGMHAILLATGGDRAPAPDAGLLTSLVRETGQLIGMLARGDRLHERVAQHEHLLSAVPGVIYRTTATGVWAYLSPFVAELTGYRSDEFTGNPDLWRAIVHPDDRPLYGMRLTEHVKDEGVLTYRVLPKGKASYRVVRDEFRYTRDASGERTAICGIIHDVTDLSGGGENGQGRVREGGNHGDAAGQ